MTHDEELPVADTHAFMIMAHDDWELLGTLISTLDHPRAHILILIDRRAHAVPLDDLRRRATRARIEFLPRMTIRWAGFSQARGELALLRAAGPRHSRYHLLSGHDLPVVALDDLYEFFDAHPSTEFVEVWATADNGRMTDSIHDRFRYYHLFELPHRRSLLGRVAKKLLLRAQKAARVDRTYAYPSPVCYGTNWFSITSDLARHVLEHEREIEKTFRFTSSPDELFLQTLVMRSHFRERLYQNSPVQTTTPNARFIDWSRPGEFAHSPRVFRTDDLDMILSSGAMFARKFDSQVDSAIIDEIAARVLRREPPSETAPRQ